MEGEYDIRFVAGRGEIGKLDGIEAGSDIARRRSQHTHTRYATSRDILARMSSHIRSTVGPAASAVARFFFNNLIRPSMQQEEGC
jgi:hypothetical protein